MKKITAWTKIEDIKDEKGNVINQSKNFNHISDGWSELAYPLAAKEEYTNQRAWKDMKWEKKLGFLDDQYKVIYA